MTNNEASRPQAVLWDMDGTLVDSEKLWDIPLREIAEHHGVRLSTEQRASLIGSNMVETSAKLLGFAGVEATSARVTEIGEWITDRVTELFAQPLPWRPGAAEALRSVREAGWASALVTSTYRDIAELALNTIGREFFDVTVCGDEVDGLNKPHPEPYAKAARLLGIDPTACVAVEDSNAGSTSARAAGAAVLVVPCDAPVQPAEGMELRDSLVGVDASELAGIHRRLAH